MLEDKDEQNIERKARRRAVISGVLTSTFIVFSLALINYFRVKPDVSLANAFDGAVCISFLLTPLGGLAGSVGDRIRDTIIGAEITAVIFCFLCFIVDLMAKRTDTLVLSGFSSFSCVLVAICTVCGSVGAAFGRSCRKFRGERFWPQYSIAELMVLVTFVAIILNRVVTSVKDVRY